MDFSIGSSACHIAVSQKRKAVDVELYINDDKELFVTGLKKPEIIKVAA